MKLKTIFHDFIDKFKDIQRKIESNWEKLADKCIRIIDRLNDLVKELMDKVGRLYIEGAPYFNHDDLVGEFESESSIMEGNLVLDDREESI